MIKENVERYSAHLVLVIAPPLLLVMSGAAHFNIVIDKGAKVDAPGKAPAGPPRIDVPGIKLNPAKGEKPAKPENPDKPELPGGTDSEPSK